MKVDVTDHRGIDIGTVTAKINVDSDDAVVKLNQLRQALRDLDEVRYRPASDVRVLVFGLVMFVVGAALMLVALKG